MTLFQLSGRDGDRDAEEWVLCLVSVKLIPCGCPGEKHSNDGLTCLGLSCEIMSRFAFTI